MITEFVVLNSLVMMTFLSTDINTTSLIAVMEETQSPVEDFRCEFEGTRVTKNQEVKRLLKLKPDGLIETFSGEYVWRSGGDAFLGCFHRNETSGVITAEQLAVRAAGRAAEHSLRNEDSKLGSEAIEDSVLTNTDRQGSFGSVFLIDSIKRLAAMKDLESSVTDEDLDGCHCKVIAFSFIGKQWPYQKFWVDLKRGAHTLRREVYGGTGALSGCTNIKLGSFQLKKQLVWMPISSISESHSILKDGKPSYSREPNMVETLYINSGTLEFNRHPNRDTFKLSPRVGTPVSDHLRKLKYEFGFQKPTPPLSKAEAETKLKAQLAKAEKQGRELVADASGDYWSSWSFWSAIVFGAATLITTTWLIASRRRR